MPYEKTKAALAEYQAAFDRISGSNPTCPVTEQYYHDLRVLGYLVRAALAKEMGPGTYIEEVEGEFHVREAASNQVTARDSTGIN